MTHPIVFRGLRNRTLADQTAALANGYTNMTTYAIDELGQLLHETRQQVNQIQGELEQLLGHKLAVDRGHSTGT